MGSVKKGRTEGWRDRGFHEHRREMKVWRDLRMERRNDGGMVEGWRDGGSKNRRGGMERWRDGEMEVSQTHLSGAVAGPHPNRLPEEEDRFWLHV